MIEAGIIFLPRLIRARLQAAQEHKASISLARKLRPHHAQEYPSHLSISAIHLCTLV